MVKNPPDGFPQITPYMLYNDVAAAIEWLCSTCGFVEQYRLETPDGSVNHAEIGLGTGVVMMGCPGPKYVNPKSLGSVTQSVYVYVDDVNAHYSQANEAGATIVRELADQFYGDRTYALRDPEGHEWTFGQHVRDVAPEDMHP